MDAFSGQGAPATLDWTSMLGGIGYEKIGWIVCHALCAGENFRK